MIDVQLRECLSEFPPIKPCQRGLARQLLREERAFMVCFEVRASVCKVPSVEQYAIELINTVPLNLTAS